MAYADRFHEAFLNAETIASDGHRQTEHKVLGYQLRPFCLWHCLMLEVADNPVLHRHEHVGFPALEQAAWICSRGYGRPGNPPRRGFLGFSRRYRGLKQLDLERSRMHAYLTDYHSLPRFWEGSGKPVKAPWQLYRVAQLVHLGHWTAEQAWLMPIGEATWYATALTEVAHGRSNLMSSADYDAMVAAGVWTED